jgi:carbamoyl-phosphate synthase large subunit
MKTVLVTGIGGNVGQGILRCIKTTGRPVRLIGCDISAGTAGEYFCDKAYKVPYADKPDYIKMIKEIVNAEGVLLIIPSTDSEGFHLSRAKPYINSEIAVSGRDACRCFFDKFATYELFKEHGIPFAETWHPGGVIIKPRRGRGSRNIIRSEYSDLEYVAQKLYRGVEITTAFYITKERDVHGYITFERELSNGMTSYARVADYDMDDIINKINECIEIKGAANIQSIVTDDGIVPFEVNCRISGTASIRSQFGFEDVKYTLQEYLLGEKPDKPDIKEGEAVRIFMDVIKGKRSYIF